MEDYRQAVRRARRRVVKTGVGQAILARREENRYRVVNLLRLVESGRKKVRGLIEIILPR